MCRLPGSSVKCTQPSMVFYYQKMQYFLCSLTLCNVLRSKNTMLTAHNSFRICSNCVPLSTSPLQVKINHLYSPFNLFIFRSNHLKNSVSIENSESKVFFTKFANLKSWNSVDKKCSLPQTTLDKIIFDTNMNFG